MFGAILGVPLVLVAILLLYLNFADLSGWRDTVSRVASDAIGRELRIKGEFQPEIGFTTRVVATDITLANADWSDEPQMVSADRLAGEIDLLSLLFGPITIDDVEISGARVLFETSTEGHFNWALGSGESDGGGGGGVELIISHALSKDLQLTYSAPQAQALEIALSKLEFTDDGTGMLDLDLNGRIGATPIEISGRLGTFVGLINAATVENDLSGNLGDIEFSTSGSIAELKTLGGADLTVRVHGQGLKAVAELFDLPGLPGGEFQAVLTVKPATTGTNLALDASMGEISTQITGTVDSLIKPGVLDVTIDASGPDVGTIGALAGIDDLPAKPFSVSGRVQWAGFPLTCDDVKVRVGDNTLSAHGVLGEPPLMMGTDFTFNGGGPDISVIAALAGLRIPKDSYSVSGRLVRLEEALDVQNVELEVGRITLKADGKIGDPPGYDGTALTLHGEGPNLVYFQKLVEFVLPAESFEIGGRLAQGDGAIDLEAIRARLGRNTLRVSGHLSTEAGLTGTDLRLKAEGPDASQVAALADLSAVPAEDFSVEGRVRVLAKGYRVHDLVGSLGSLTVTVDGFVGPPPTLFGSDLQIHVEDADLAHPASIAGVTDLPHDPISIDTRVRIDEAGYRLTGLDAAVGDIEVLVDGFVGSPPELHGTDLQVEVRGGRIAALGPYLKQPSLPTVPFSVSGGVRVEDTSILLDRVVAKVEENRAEVTGTVMPSDHLAGTDLELEIRGGDLSQAGRLAAGFVDLPTLPSEPFTLGTRLEIDGAGYSIDGLHATLADATASINGRVGFPPNFFGTDLTIDANGPNASLFVALTGVTMPVAPFQLEGRIERNDTGFRFHGVTARLGEYHAAVDGALGKPPKLIGTDLEINASGPGTGLIQELARLPNLPDQPFELDGEFTGTPDRFATREFSLTFGPSDIEGSFTIDITGKPNVQARLTSTTLDLSRLRERLEKGDAIAEEPSEAPVSANKGRLIPDEPLNLAFLQKANADVAIRVKKLVLSAKVFHDLKIDLDLEDGRLEIERIEAVGQAQGRMTGNLVLEPDGDEQRLQAGLSAHQLRLDIAGSEVDRSNQPPIDIDIDVEARGTTPHGLASSANGSLQVVIGKGVMDRGVLDLVTTDILLTLVNAFNPFAKEDVATEMQCGVMLVTFENGLAKLEPMAIQSDKMTMLGKGRIDLGTEKLNIDWVTKPRKGIGISASMITNPYIKLGGTLANPAVELKPLEAVTSTGVAVATLGISVVAKGMYDRVTAEKKVCKEALEQIGRESGNPSKNSKKKRR